MKESYRYGTCHFKSLKHVERYYGAMAFGSVKLDESAVHIGKPDLRPSEKLSVDKDGRYWIEVSAPATA